MTPVRAFASLLFLLAAMVGCQRVTSRSDAEHWVCPMHARIVSPHRGKCSICGMELVRRAGGQELSSALNSEVRDAIGLRTEMVDFHEMRRVISLGGKIEVDSLAKRQISAGAAGRIENLSVLHTGDVIRKNQQLATYLSPTMNALVRQFISLRQLTRPSIEQSRMLEADLQRLQFAGMTAGQAAALAPTDLSHPTMPLLSPFSGTLSAIRVVNGQSFAEGDTLFEFSDAHPKWFAGTVYADEASLLRPGLGISIQLADGSLEESVIARVNRLNGEVRAKVKDGITGQIAEARVALPLGSALTITRSAVLDLGDRQVVYREHPTGRFTQVTVKIGRHGDDQVEVLSGLRRGDRAVSRAALFLEAESREY